MSDPRVKFEENRLRRRGSDKKTKGTLMYMSLLLIVNKTWGRVSELLDLLNVLTSNLYSTEDGIIWDAENQKEIYLEKGRALRNYALQDQKAILEKWIAEDSGFALDGDGFLKGVLMEEIIDRSIATSKVYERKALNQIGGWKNTQNASTMINRGQKAITAYIQAQG